MVTRNIALTQTSITVITIVFSLATAGLAVDNMVRGHLPAPWIDFLCFAVAIGVLVLSIKSFVQRKRENGTRQDIVDHKFGGSRQGASES